MSNELKFKLPLNLDEICLPDITLRKSDKELYDEYMEVFELNVENKCNNNLIYRNF